MHDYSRKSGVEETFLMAPKGAPDWALDRAALWNAAEAAETRINAVVAREWELALPAEISPDERRGIVSAFAQELVERYGVAVDVAIHAPHREGDDRNHHAHVLTTTRVMGEDGLGAKTRVLDAAQTGGPEITAMRDEGADRIGAGLAAMRAALDRQRAAPEAGDGVADKLRRILGREAERGGGGSGGVEQGDVRARLDAALGRTREREGQRERRALPMPGKRRGWEPGSFGKPSGCSTKKRARPPCR